MRLFICALWSPAGKGLTSWLSFAVSNCPIGILGQVWYLIVSIPGLCLLPILKTFFINAMLIRVQRKVHFRIFQFLVMYDMSVYVVL